MTATENTANLTPAQAAAIAAPIRLRQDVVDALEAFSGNAKYYDDLSKSGTNGTRERARNTASANAWKGAANRLESILGMPITA